MHNACITNKNCSDYRSVKPSGDEIKPIPGCASTACLQFLFQIKKKLLSCCYKVNVGDSLATSCYKIQAVFNTLFRGSCQQRF